MDYNEEEFARGNAITQHILIGLSHEGLIESLFEAGPVEKIKLSYESAPKDGLIFHPSVLGCELFLWVHGQPNVTLPEFLSPSIVLESVTDIYIPGGYSRSSVRLAPQ